MNKNPWIAVVLNIFLTGSAYLYLRKRMLFGTLLLISTVLGYIWTFTSPLAQKVSTDPLYILTIILIVIAFAIDAYREAKSLSLQK